MLEKPLPEPRHHRMFKRLSLEPKRSQIKRTLEIIPEIESEPDITAMRSNYLQDVPCLTDSLQIFFAKVEVLENLFGVPVLKAQVDDSEKVREIEIFPKVMRDRALAVRTSPTAIKERALAAASKIDRVTHYNNSHIDAEDTVAHEDRFWMTYYTLVSGLSHVDDYDNDIETHPRFQGHQNSRNASGQSIHSRFALRCIPKPVPGVNLETFECASLKNRAGFALRELLKARIWYAVRLKYDMIHTHWLEVRKDASVEYTEAVHDVFFCVQILKADLCKCSHLIGTMCLERSVLSMVRTDVASFWEIMVGSGSQDPDAMDFEWTMQNIDSGGTSQIKLEDEPSIVLPMRRKRKHELEVPSQPMNIENESSDSNLSMDVRS